MVLLLEHSLADFHGIMELLGQEMLHSLVLFVLLVFSVHLLEVMEHLVMLVMEHIVIVDLALIFHLVILD